MPLVIRRHPKIALIVVMLLAVVGVWSAAAMRLMMWRTATPPILEINNDSLTTYLPSAATPIQDIRPHLGQRGVGVDGQLRGGTAFGLAVNANPFDNNWSGGPQTNGPVELSLGVYRAADVDISLPAPGFRWNVGRTYNSRQEDDAAAHRDSDGYQGKNWFQNTQPELVLYEHATDDDKDVLYIVYGAERFLEFKRVDIAEGTSDTFKGVNGTAGCVEFTDAAGIEPENYTYTDQHGNVAIFIGFDGNAGSATGQLWKITDPDGNVAYAGDSTRASDAVSDGYDGITGALTTAYDSADRRYSYSYTTLNSTDRLTEVKAETKTGGTWVSPTGLAEVAKVEYEYYGDEDHGGIGDLKLVEITTPLSDSGVSSTKKKYYRYWEGTYNASTNPGHDHHLRLVLGYEGCRNYDYSGDSTFDEDFLTASESSIEAYADAYVEYDANNRVDLAWFQGGCGCSGSGDGTHEYEYETNGSYSDDAGYDTEWAMRTVVKRPDATYGTQYFDEVHQPSHSVITDDDPDNTSPAPDFWATHITRNTTAQVRKICTASNITTYTHSTGSFASTTTGLQWLFNFKNTSDATDQFQKEKKWREGNTGSWTYYEDWTWTTANVSVGDGDSQVDRPVIDDYVHYLDEETSSPTSDETWDYTTTFYSGKLAIEKITTSEPVVATGNNGSGSAVTRKRYFNEDGTLAFELSGTGVVTYREYTNGQTTKVIQDADTTETGSGEDFESVTIPDGFASTGSPVHVRTEDSYDAQGRRNRRTAPGGSDVGDEYTSKLADERLVRIKYPKFETGPDTWHGPAMATVMNHAGRVEAQMTVAISGGTTTTAQTGHVDETDADPITAMDLGTVAALTTTLYSEGGGSVEESRLYHTVPASGDGSDGTNYDPTVYGYNDSGLRTRVKAAHGTITQTDYDLHGRVTARWIGTNDAVESGTDDIVKVEELEYDSGNDNGLGFLTKRTLHLDDSGSNTRVTTYANDVRGRVLLVTNPTAPHTFHKYDNLGRTLATGMFSATTNIVAASDDPTTETSTRLTLTQTFYDERGMVWKSQRHKIDVDDGSDDDNLQSLTWYDEDGRVIKADGAQLTKTTYNDLGQVTHQFILASDDDTTYAHAADVSGDVVMQESQSIYNLGDGVNEDGELMFTVRIDREHDDEGAGQTTGALDTNADTDPETITAANIEGRIQIRGLWYDDLGRVIDRVRFGTNAGSNYTHAATPNAPSATELRTTYTFNDDGTLEKAKDPREFVTYFEYDDAGRKTKDVRNYDSSVNSGNPSGSDDNVTVKYEFTDGLMTKLTADLPSGSTDQDTLYIYGTTNGTPSASEIASGHLLRATVYPDSTNTGTTEANINSDSSDVVSFAYNAQSQQVEKKDQAGNVFGAEFDSSGRTTNLKWSTAAGGFDTAVRRIERSYDSVGRPDLVTQYDAVTSGNVVDESRYTYEDWGNLSAYDYDRDSAVDAGGSDDEYSISYTWAKATGGRNTIRRTQAAFPSGNVIDYTYSSTDSNDSDLSRVTEVKDGATSLAAYEYLGVGMVVGTTYDEPGSFYRLYESANDYDARLDRFNRVTESTWTKDLSTDRDFYSVTVGWDEGGNVTDVEDHVHVGFDVKYDIDDIDRVTRADEGSLSGGSITSRTRDQQWTLDQVGNWDRNKLDLDGDGLFTGTDELDEARAGNDVNELTARDIDNDSTDDFSLTYDANGNLTDDGEDYEYVWDGFGRLRKINSTSDQSLVAEYKYNGLGHLSAVHEDTDDDGDVDSNDKWFYRMYDERWRWIGTFREDDSDPKEEYIPHQAGVDGRGGSSYIDLVILRDRDGDNSEWVDAADGTMEERIYYCQNWRADVSAVVEDTGEMVEWVKYSAYGVPFGLPRGDTDSDGDADATDRSNINGSASYDVREDVDLDGDVGSVDESEASNKSLGYGELSIVLGRRGVAGYQWSNPLGYFARHRAVSAALGRWLARDPLGYGRGTNLSEAFASNPIRWVDPAGLAVQQSGTGAVVITFVPDSSMDGQPDPKARRAVALAMDALRKNVKKCREHELWKCKNCKKYTHEWADPGTPGGTPSPQSGGGHGKYSAEPTTPSPIPGLSANELHLLRQLMIADMAAMGSKPSVIITYADIFDSNGAVVHGYHYEGTTGPGQSADGMVVNIDANWSIISHELGHFLGYVGDVGGHSSDPDSIMNKSPTKDAVPDCEWCNLVCDCDC